MRTSIIIINKLYDFNHNWHTSIIIIFLFPTIPYNTQPREMATKGRQSEKGGRGEERGKDILVEGREERGKDIYWWKKMRKEKEGKVEVDMLR